MTDQERPMNQRPEFNAALASFLGTQPTLLWGYYWQLQAEGFTKEQAFRLTRDFQLATMGKPPQERDR